MFSGLAKIHQFFSSHTCCTSSTRISRFKKNSRLINPPKVVRFDDENGISTQKPKRAGSRGEGVHRDYQLVAIKILCLHQIGHRTDVKSSQSGFCTAIQAGLLKYTLDTPRW